MGACGRGVNKIIHWREMFCDVIWRLWNILIFQVSDFSSFPPFLSNFPSYFSHLIIFSIYLYVLFSFYIFFCHSPYIFLYLLLKLHFALSHFLPCHSSYNFTISLLNDITVSLYFFFYFSLSLSHSFYLSQCGHFFTHTILCKCNNIDIGRLQTLFVYQN